MEGSHHINYRSRGWGVGDTWRGPLRSHYFTCPWALPFLLENVYFTVMQFAHGFSFILVTLPLPRNTIFRVIMNSFIPIIWSKQSAISEESNLARLFGGTSSGLDLRGTFDDYVLSLASLFGQQMRKKGCVWSRTWQLRNDFETQTPRKEDPRLWLHLLFGDTAPILMNKEVMEQLLKRINGPSVHWSEWLGKAAKLSPGISGTKDGGCFLVHRRHIYSVTGWGITAMY